MTVPANISHATYLRYVKRRISGTTALLVLANGEPTISPSVSPLARQSGEHFLRRAEGLAPALILGSVLIVLTALSLGWARARRGIPLREALARSALDGSLVVFFVVLIVLTLRPDSTPAPPGFHLVPFSDLGHSGRLVEMLSNVLLFIPFGILVPLCWPKLRSWKTIAVAGCAVSLAIETMQFLLRDGRSATIQDVLLNSAGTLIGFAGLAAGLRVRKERGASVAASPVVRGKGGPR